MSGKVNSLQLFFPIQAGGLDRQQFLNEVLCPQIKRGTTESTRSALAKILYDDFFDGNSLIDLDKDAYQRIIKSRQGTRNKMFSIHPNFHSEFEEAHNSIKSENLSVQRDYEEYVKFMSNLGTSQLAAMTPFVNLIYRYREKKNDPWKEFVVPFKSFSTDDEFTFEKKKEMLTSRFNRGDGAGIESVSVNRNFPAIGNLLSVTVNMAFFFQNIGILTRKQEVGGLKDFSFIKVMGFLAPQFEELVLEYGYGISRFTDPSIIPPKMQTQILLREKKRFVLRYKGHDFDLEQDGSVKLNVSYTTQQDQDLFSRKSDVAIPKDKVLISSLAVEPSAKRQLTTYRKLLNRVTKLEEEQRNIKKEEIRRKEAPKVTGTAQNKSAVLNLQRRKKEVTDRIIKTNKSLNALRNQLSPHVKQKFIETIRKNKDLFKISFTTGANQASNNEDARDYALNATLSLEELIDNKIVDTKIADLTTGVLNDQFENSLVFDEVVEGSNKKEKLVVVNKVLSSLFNVPEGTTRSRNEQFGDILFFSIRSLIAAAYSDLEDDYKERVPFVGLSNVTTKSFGRQYSVNIGDILVSVDTFQKWYYKNYTSKRVITYSFGDFLNDIMTKLVPEILENNSSSLFGNNRIGSIRPINYLTKMKPNRKNAALFRSVYTNGSNKQNLKKLAIKVKQVNEIKTTKNLTSVVLYTNLKNPSNPVGSPFLKRNLKDTNFSEATDIKFGSPHIKIGADSGLLKSINFSSKDFPGLRTALWAESLTDSAEVLLKYKYSADATTIGNNIFFKGGYFTIPSNPLGISRDSFDPGIVGYYYIQRVVDSVSIGSYETSIQGTWTYNPLTDKGETGTDVTGQVVDETIPPFELGISVLGYLEDLFRLDQDTLQQNNLNSSFRPIGKPKENLPFQDDNRKDIKEPI